MLPNSRAATINYYIIRFMRRDLKTPMAKSRTNMTMLKNELLTIRPITVDYYQLKNILIKL